LWAVNRSRRGVTNDVLKSPVKGTRVNAKRILKSAFAWGFTIIATKKPLKGQSASLLHVVLPRSGGIGGWGTIQGVFVLRRYVFYDIVSKINTSDWMAWKDRFFVWNLFSNLLHVNVPGNI
jgi:hypothetical protein